MAKVDVAIVGGLTAQVGWLGLRVSGRLALTYIRVNSRSDFVIMTAP